jgi:hypothetical protein
LATLRFADGAGQTPTGGRAKTTLAAPVEKPISYRRKRFRSYFLP